MNRCSKRSFGMKLIGLMTAAIMLLACCMPAFAAESETRTNTESFQLLTYSEDSASMGSGWTTLRHQCLGHRRYGFQSDGNRLFLH